MYFVCTSNDPGTGIVGEAILIFIAVAIPIIILTLVLRAIFRIDKIVDMLEKIEANTRKPHVEMANTPKNVPTGMCYVCKKTLPFSQLIQRGAGHICPTCKAVLDPAKSG
jgi:hypothetical protein